MKKILLVLIFALSALCCENENSEPADAGKVIFIHASEGGYKVPKTSADSTITEKMITTTFSRELKKNLENKGYEVFLSESSKNYLTYEEITEQAEGKDIRALITVRTSWSPEKRKVAYRGVNLWYNSSNSESQHLDSLVHQSMEIHSNIMARNLGLKTMAILGIPDVPGFMIELGNINDKDDLALMKNKKYRANLINSISFALDDYMRFYK